MTEPEERVNPAVEIEEIEKMIEELLKDFAARDLSALSPEQANLLASMPHKMQQYLKGIALIKKSKAEEKNIKDPRQQYEKKRENEEKIAQITKEIFIIACASNKPMDELMDFQKRANLGVKGMNEFGENGMNPLVAALAGNRSQADLDKLLKNGADINFKSPQGSNAAHFAVMLGVETKTMEFLIERGVDVNAKNNLGMTPLDMAALKGDEAMVKTLAENGAKLGRVTQSSQGQDEENAPRRPRKPEKRQMTEEEKEARELVKQQKQEALEKVTSERAARDAAEITIALALAEETRLKGLEFMKQQRAAQAAEQKKEKDAQAAAAAPQTPATSLVVTAVEPIVATKQKTAEQEMLEKMLGVEFEKIDLNKMLFAAVNNGNSTVALCLMRLGGDVNHRENGVSVLDVAVSKGNNSLAGILAERANPDTLKAAVTVAQNTDLASVLQKAAAAPKEKAQSRELVVADKRELSAQAPKEPARPSPSVRATAMKELVLPPMPIKVK